MLPFKPTLPDLKRNKSFLPVVSGPLRYGLNSMPSLACRYNCSFAFVAGGNMQLACYAPADRALCLSTAGNHPGCGRMEQLGPGADIVTVCDRNKAPPQDPSTGGNLRPPADLSSWQSSGRVTGVRNEASRSFPFLPLSIQGTPRSSSRPPYCRQVRARAHA